MNLCPYHGFGEYVVLHLFYREIDNESKDIIDLSADGRVMFLTLEEGSAMIEKNMTINKKWNIEEPSNHG